VNPPESQISSSSWTLQIFSLKNIYVLLSHQGHGASFLNMVLAVLKSSVEEINKDE
jgi:hypothetical protein